MHFLATTLTTAQRPIRKTTQQAVALQAVELPMTALPTDALLQPAGNSFFFISSFSLFVFWFFLWYVHIVRTSRNRCNGYVYFNQAVRQDVRCGCTHARGRGRRVTVVCSMASAYKRCTFRFLEYNITHSTKKLCPKKSVHTPLLLFRATTLRLCVDTPCAV